MLKDGGDRSLSRVWGSGRSYIGFWLVERSEQLPSTQAGPWPCKGSPQGFLCGPCRGWGWGVQAALSRDDGPYLASEHGIPMNHPREMLTTSPPAGLVGRGGMARVDSELVGVLEGALR